MANDGGNAKKEAVETGWIVIKFTKNWGSRKVGDKETYHTSTANSLLKRKVAVKAETLKKYQPKKIVE
mgnify:CR=1 FL=1